MLWYTVPDLSFVTLHNRALIDQHQVKVIHVQIFCKYFKKDNKKMLCYYVIFYNQFQIIPNQSVESTIISHKSRFMAFLDKNIDKLLNTK